MEDVETDRSAGYEDGKSEPRCEQRRDVKERERNVRVAMMKKMQEVRTRMRAREMFS